MRTLLSCMALQMARAALLSSVLAGCSTLDVKQVTVEQTVAVKQAPEAQPHRSITNFSAALRCMDGMLFDYGVRDLSMLVEEIPDLTTKVNAGTRDMLISAVSDMTRRSRAIRLVAFGADATNVITLLEMAQRRAAYAVIPQFDIKGSVTQWDENLVQNQKDAGLSVQPWLNVGVSREAASSMLSLDLSVLTTDDLSVLAGVTSRNSVVILRQGKGLDGDAAYQKFGIKFRMTFSKSEGQAQALRGLVELAAVELMGKLTKIPYWSCLGADAKVNDEIRQEISDWYFAMATSRVELIGYFQNQLRRRGFYDGPVDGKFNDAIDQAIANYRAALGLSKEAVLDEAFFTAFLNADHSKVHTPQQPARYVAAAETAVASVTAAATPAAGERGALALKFTVANNQTRFARGELVNLSVRPNQDAYVYCYIQDETARIKRFYPNRFARDSFVPATRPLTLPGAQRFQIVMNPLGVKETIACFATRRDVMAALPSAVVGTDFEPLAVATLEQIHDAFANVAGGVLAQERFHVQAK